MNLFKRLFGPAPDDEWMRAWAMAPIAHWESNKRIAEAVAMNRLRAQAERDNENFDNWRSMRNRRSRT